MAKYQVTDKQIESIFARIKHLENTLKKDLSKADRLRYTTTLNALESAVGLLDLDDQLDEYLKYAQ